MYLLQAYEDIQSVESAFADLHRRYEKTKPVIESFKKVGQQLSTLYLWMSIARDMLLLDVEDSLSVVSSSY